MTKLGAKSDKASLNGLAMVIIITDMIHERARVWPTPSGWVPSEEALVLLQLVCIMCQTDAVLTGRHKHLWT